MKKAKQQAKWLKQRNKRMDAKWQVEAEMQRRNQDFYSHLWFKRMREVKW